jgi:hypothetical protein
LRAESFTRIPYRRRRALRSRRSIRFLLDAIDPMAHTSFLLLARL